MNLRRSSYCDADRGAAKGETEEVADVVDGGLVAADVGGKFVEDDEEDIGTSVIEKRFPGDQRGQAWGGAEGVEDTHHCHRICCTEDGGHEETLGPTDVGACRWREVVLIGCL